MKELFKFCGDNGSGYNTFAIVDLKKPWSVRLDVYVNDDKGTIYNAEMQRGRKKELPKRSRYYQGSVDLDAISKGEEYTKLRKTYIIFICTFDPFNEGRHLYTFRNACRENPALLLGDETEKVFLNTRGIKEDVDEELIELLSYIENTTDAFAEAAKSPLIGEIHRKVIQVKQSRELEVEYLTLFQRDRENQEIGRAEGRAEGREQGGLLTTQIIKLHSKGISAKEIAEQLKLELSYVEKMIESYERE